MARMFFIALPYLKLLSPYSLDTSFFKLKLSSFIRKEHITLDAKWMTTNPCYRDVCHSSPSKQPICFRMKKWFYRKQALLGYHSFLNASFTKCKLVCSWNCIIYGVLALTIPTPNGCSFRWIAYNHSFVFHISCSLLTYRIILLPFPKPCSESNNLSLGWIFHSKCIRWSSKLWDL